MEVSAHNNDELWYPRYIPGSRDLHIRRPYKLICLPGSPHGEQRRSHGVFPGLATTKLLFRSSIIGSSAYRDLSYSALTDSGVGQDLALFLGFELLDSIEFSAIVGLVHSPVGPTGDEAHDVVFQFYRCAGVVFPRTVGSHEVLWRCGHGLEEGQAGRHPKKQAPRSCRVKVTRVRLARLLRKRRFLDILCNGGIYHQLWKHQKIISSRLVCLSMPRKLALSFTPLSLAFHLGEGRCESLSCWCWTQTTSRS